LIAEVHVESWKTTYTGIFPDTLLESLSIDYRESSWKGILGQLGLVTLLGCEGMGQGFQHHCHMVVAPDKEEHRHLDG
jgi:hypothetical protein